MAAWSGRVGSAATALSRPATTSARQPVPADRAARRAAAGGPLRIRSIRTRAPLAPGRVSSAILLRVGRLAPEAPALARSVAVLGDQACSPSAGARRARTARASSSRPVWPTSRSSSTASRCGSSTPSCGRRSTRRSRGPGAGAARPGRQAARFPGAARAVAVHLLATTPSGDADVRRTRWAGGAARAPARRPGLRGALLRRALDEPPDGRAAARTMLARARPRRGPPLGTGPAQWGTFSRRRNRTTDDHRSAEQQALILLGGHPWLGPALPGYEPRRVPRYERAARGGRPGQPRAGKPSSRSSGARCADPASRALSPPFEDEVEPVPGLPRCAPPTEYQMPSGVLR